MGERAGARRIRIAAGLCLGLLTALAGTPTRADDPAAPPAAAPAPAPPPLRSRLLLGRTVRTRGAVVVAVRLAPDLQPGLGGHVGLSFIHATVSHLPGPAGEWHVRVRNPLDVPLLVPAGEVLLTPQGPSRMTDRPVWIPASAATFVPVVQTVDPAPPGPYLSRGNLLTPVERALEDLDALRRRIRLRNGAFGVDAARRDDAGAAFVSPGFLERLPPYEGALSSLANGHDVVGVFVVGERGIHFAHVEFDAARFRALWPALLRGIALDGMRIEDAGMAPTPNVQTLLQQQARSLLALLDPEPLRRPNFGRGEERLWTAAGRDEVWRGLFADGHPVSLTLIRRPPAPTPPGAGPGTPAGPGPGGTGGTETPAQPGRVELQRRGPRTQAEKRLDDRQRGATNAPPGLPRSGTPSGGGIGPSRAR